MGTCYIRRAKYRGIDRDAKDQWGNGMYSKWKTLSHQPESIRLIIQQALLKPIETMGTQEESAETVTFGLLVALPVKLLYGPYGENLAEQSINKSVLQPLEPRL